MTDRERLIELLDKKQYQGNAVETSVNYIQNSELADYLIENGVIVLPCRVGDVVWDRNGEPHKVISIEWYSKKVMHLHCEHHTFSVGKRSIGKTVFLTREEAEKALKEREENGTAQIQPDSDCGKERGN